MVVQCKLVVSILIYNILVTEQVRYSRIGMVRTTKSCKLCDLPDTVLLKTYLLYIPLTMLKWIQHIYPDLLGVSSYDKLNTLKNKRVVPLQ